MSPDKISRTSSEPTTLVPPLPDDAEQQAIFETEAIPHLGEIFRHAMWLAQNRATAEDLTQDTFKQALQSFTHYTAGTNCRAWLLRILYRLNSKRRFAAARMHFVDNFDESLLETFIYEPSTPQDLTDEDILQTLALLPWKFQEVIVMSDVEDFSYKEIAALLDVPLGTIMSRLHRGRKILRTGLAVYAQAYGINRVDNTHS
ncbi:MAG: sigma-70 family RNA polymerase sigma factor [Pyrinomonadaceae bacterium]